jgi:phosphoglycerate dehydrogenase-like enzyme
MAEDKALISEPPVIELRGKVLGLVGLGRIGRKMAQLCGSGLGMEVLAYDPHISPADAAPLNVTLCTTLGNMLRMADFVSIHCPPSESTRGMIDADALAAMKSSAYLVNCARGMIVDEPALVEALRAGTIAGAGLDVYDPEPPAPDNPLLAMENVVATPHSAGYTDGCQLAMGMGVAEQVLAVLSGKRPANLVNPTAWDSPDRRCLHPQQGASGRTSR